MLVALDTTAPPVPRSGIRVSANPVQPQDAIDHFRAKSPLDKAAWQKLDAEARNRAFTAAWVTDVAVLQSVKDSLDKAIASGESFESWKKAIRAELGNRWRRGDPYLETVFRNNVQSAYAAGRYQASTAPTILRLRPFWRLVVLLDDRTSPYCRPLVTPPVVLPAEDPWWSANYPPRHHLCRATVATLSQRQAERLGILKAAPSVGAQDGWGSTAGIGAWQPSGYGIDPAIFTPAAKAAARAAPDVGDARAPVPQLEHPKQPAEVPRVTGDYAAHLRVSGARFDPEDEADLRAAAHHLFGEAGPPTTAALESAWGGGDFSVVVKKATPRGKRAIEYEGAVMHNGKAVGSITRTFARRDGESLEVKHDYLKIPDVSLHGKGFGESMLRQSIRSYERIGVAKIKLDAEYVGKYTWASFGFDWDAETAREKRERLAEFLQEHGVSKTRAKDIASRAANHSWDVAALDVDGLRESVGRDVSGKLRMEKLGKAFLLRDAAWSGVLKLDPSSPAYKRAKERLKF